MGAIWIRYREIYSRELIDNNKSRFHPNEKASNGQIKKKVHHWWNKSKLKFDLLNFDRVSDPAFLWLLFTKSYYHTPLALYIIESTDYFHECSQTWYCRTFHREKEAAYEQGINDLWFCHSDEMIGCLTYSHGQHNNCSQFLCCCVYLCWSYANCSMWAFSHLFHRPTPYLKFFFVLAHSRFQWIRYRVGCLYPPLYKYFFNGYSQIGFRSLPIDLSPVVHNIAVNFHSDRFQLLYFLFSWFSRYLFESMYSVGKHTDAVNSPGFIYSPLLCNMYGVSVKIDRKPRAVP